MRLTKAQAIHQAQEVCLSVSNDPQARLRLREDFYRRYGDPILQQAGYGNSELDFLRWEIERGVLNPMEDSKPGSPWWRAVNLKFIYVSELASILIENELDPADFEEPVRFWVDYIRTPTPSSWYKAHNCSIVTGYLLEEELALQENEYERAFMNIVLYRLLYAQQMVEGESEFGPLGEILANPRWDSVELIVNLPDFYPTDYPLTKEGYEEIQGRIDSLQDWLVRLMDHVLIMDELEELYQDCANWNHTPDLMKLLDGREKPIYPRAQREPAPNPTQPKEPTMPPEKKKIVILGGGISGLSAAFDLTEDPYWKERYEITLYQQGWRCGGKMRGGRGPNGRVEELGLHLLLGWYENAFPLYRKAYEERTANDLAPQSPYKTLDDAIVKNNATLMVEYREAQNRWINWPLVFPENNYISGDGPPLPTKDLIKKGVGILLETILGSPYAGSTSLVAKWILDHFFPKEGGDHIPNIPAPPKKPNWFVRLFHKFDDFLEDTIGIDISKELDELWDDYLEQDSIAFLTKILKYLDKLVDGLYSLLNRLGMENDELRRLYILTEMGVCLLRAMLTDVYDPKTDKFDYSRVSDIDLRDWLRKFGASDTTLYSPMVEFFYTGTFEALDDNRDQGGLLAASTALQFFLPALGYKGSFCYQLRLGTADTLIMPLYQVLAHRGVKFEFFHRITDIKSDATDEIREIQMNRQIDLVGDSYDPKIWVKGNPAWPGEPNWQQLNPLQAKHLQNNQINLEDPWSGYEGVGKLSLKLGEDFDYVFCGIPVKALGDCAKELMAQKKEWKNMVEKLGTAQVQSAQLWFQPTLAGLGFKLEEWGMGEEFCVPNVVTYQNPMFSWLDQSYIIENEDWPTDHQPKMLAMFTGILPDEPEIPPYSDHDFPKREYERVKNTTWQWLQDNMGFFFRNARTRAYPPGINYELLLDPEKMITDGRIKYRNQFFMAAIAPEDRYTIALPGTDKYRLKPEDSLYENMLLVGDWTNYGCNIGYMEGCILSSHQAVSAFRKKLQIPFQTQFWEDPDSSR